MENRLVKQPGFEFEFNPANGKIAFAEEIFLNGQIRPSYHQQMESARKNIGILGEKNHLPLIVPAKKVFVRYDEREMMEKYLSCSAIESRRSNQKLLANRRKSYLPYRPALLGCSSLSGTVVDCHHLPGLKEKRDP